MENIQYAEAPEFNPIAESVNIEELLMWRPQPIRETLIPCCIGHTFTKYPGFPGEPVRYVIQDFLVDSSGISGGGAPMEPIIQVGLNESIKAVYSIKTGKCKNRFEVIPPKGALCSFSSYLGRQSIHPHSGFYDAYPATIVFNGLSGTAPVINYCWFFIQNGRNDAFHFVIQGNVTGTISFDSISVYAMYPHRNFLPVISFCKPLSYAAPFGLGVTACYFLFGYSTTSSNDPGPLVRLI
ncbi:MAG: hypothetical protein ACKVOW_12580 [Chitinophagaceae bacterium]